MSSRAYAAAAVVLSALMPVACEKPSQPLPLARMEKDYSRPLPPGELALRKLTDPSMYPRFGDAWYRAKGVALRKAVQHSIDYLNAPSSRQYYPVGPITHDDALASLELFLRVLEEASSPDALDERIRQDFDVYISVGCDDAGTVLFTGYYTPIFEGSLTRTEQFRFPLYKLPAEIQKDEQGNVIGGPWYTREEIEKNHMLDGQELVWLSDRFEAYVITVQGSGFIRLPDDSLYEIGYAGNNGHDYTPIGKMLVADGKIDRNHLSLAAMLRHFKQYPQDMDEYLFQNKRYVFFQDSEGGPYGCLGKPVTAEFSIATDKDIFPRAGLAFVDTWVPGDGSHGKRRLRSFVLDQDRGAAIRAPGRCDLYMGVGDEAGRRAGYTYYEGKLYYLIAKPEAAAPQAVAQTPDGE